LQMGWHSEANGMQSKTEFVYNTSSSHQGRVRMALTPDTKLTCKE